MDKSAGRYTLKIFDVIIDPERHISSFQIKILLRGQPDKVYIIGKNFKTINHIGDVHKINDTLKLECIIDDNVYSTYELTINEELKDEREHDWNVPIDKYKQGASLVQSNTHPKIKIKLLMQFSLREKRGVRKILGNPFKSRKSEIKETDNNTKLKLIENKNIDGIRLFLSTATKEELNRGVDDQGNSLLHIACIDCAIIPVQIIKEFLSHPYIDVNNQNKALNTPLHYLCSKWQLPNLEVFDMLLKLQADVNCVNAAGESPLFKAIVNRSVRYPIVQRLLEGRANLNQLNSHNEGILHYVARQGNVDILDLILAKCHSESLKQKGREELTAKQIAIVEAEKQKHRAREFEQIYRKLCMVEEIDTFLGDLGLMEYREFFITEGIDLQVMFNMSEAEIDDLPLKIGPKAKLQKALAEKRKEYQNPLLLSGPMVPVANDDTINQSLLDFMSGTDEKVPVVQYDQLEFFNELGTGASGKVWKGTLRQPGEERGREVAIKMIMIQSEDYVDEFKTEIMVLHSISHPNVVKLFGVCVKPNPILIMEYCALGSLYHVINNENNYVGWPQFFSICKQAVLGLNALHTHIPKILHRDLKTLNLLMTKDWKVKVADFGLSLDTNAKTDVLIEMRGTTVYLPPELFHALKYSTKSDVYSLGIIFWEMLYRVINQKYMRPYGELPFAGHTSEMVLIVKVANEGLRPTMPKNVPPDLDKLVRQCIKSQQEDRPKCVDVLVLLEKAEEDYLLNKEMWEKCIIQKKE